MAPRPMARRVHQNGPLLISLLLSWMLFRYCYCCCVLSRYCQCYVVAMDLWHGINMPPQLPWTCPCPPAERSGHRVHRLELVLDAQAEASVDVHGALEGVQGRVRMSWQRPVLQDMAPFLLQAGQVIDRRGHVIVEESLDLDEAGVDGGLEGHGPCIGTVLILLLVHVLALVQVLVLVHVLVLV